MLGHKSGDYLRHNGPEHVMAFASTRSGKGVGLVILTLSSGPYSAVITDILVDLEGALERRNHWEKTGHALLIGAILQVLHAEADKTLAGVATFLSNPSRSFERTLWDMMNTNHLGNSDKARCHPVVAQAAREFLNKSDNERSGMLSTAMSFLGLYRDLTVAEVTSSYDWRTIGR